MNKQLLTEIIRMPYEAKDDTFVVDGNNMPILSIEYIGERRFQPSENGRVGYEYNLAAEVFLDFTAAAINEKVKRDIYKPLRWQKDIGYHFCPECKKVFNDERNPIKEYKFCPYCGQPLDQPLEELLIGEKVKMVKCLEAEKYKDRVWVVASEPWKVGDSWVVRLNGYSGGFDIECLEVVK